MKLDELRRQKLKLNHDISEACNAIFWSTPRLQERSFDTSGISAERTLLFCVRGTPLRGNPAEKTQISSQVSKKRRPALPVEVLFSSLTGMKMEKMFS